jgi:hypothetical protein
MIELEITADTRSFMVTIDDLAVDQVPFALSRTLNKLAVEARDDVRDTVGDGRFILRQPAFIRAGVQAEMSTKADLVAKVKDIDSFMLLQEKGGQKLPHHGRFIAVPLSGARSSPRAMIAEGDMPQAVMASGMGFIKENANGVPIMYRTVLKRGRSRKLKGTGVMAAPDWNRTIIPMYALVPSASVEPRLGFRPTVLAALSRDKMQSYFAQFFEDAKRTAKR